MLDLYRRDRPRPRLLSDHGLWSIAILLLGLGLLFALVLSARGAG
jgi:hypothetical protein